MRRFQQSFFVGAVENGDVGALAAKQEARRPSHSGPLPAPQLFFPGISRFTSVSAWPSPSSAKMADRIQNRTITVFSFQPVSSK